MKTIYVENNGPKRISIPNRLHASIVKAAGRVSRFVKSEPAWQTTIQIPLMNYNNLYAVISGEEGTVKTEIIETKPYFPFLEPTVDPLQSVIDEKDYLSLPDVWFSDGFMDEALIDNLGFPSSARGYRRVPVLERHRNLFLERAVLTIETEMDKRVEWSLTEIEHRRMIAFQSGVLSIVQDVQEGRLQFTTLQEVWSGRTDLLNHEEWDEIDRRLSDQLRDAINQNIPTQGNIERK